MSTALTSRLASCVAMLAAALLVFAAAGTGRAQTNCPTPAAKAKRDSCYSAGIRECASKHNVQTTSYLQCDNDLKKSCAANAGCQ